MPAKPLTAEESQAVAAAMVQCSLKGDHAGAAKLAKLAADPDKVREVLAGKGAGE